MKNLCRERKNSALKIHAPVTTQMLPVPTMDVDFSIENNAQINDLALWIINADTKKEILIASDIDLTSLSSKVDADGTLIYTYTTILPKNLNRFYFKLTGTL